MSDERASDPTAVDPADPGETEKTAEPSGAEADSDLEAPDEPRPKKKRKRKPKASAKENAPAGAAVGEGEEDKPKPLPGLGTADGEKLVRAERALEAGNYALVRKLTGELGDAAEAEVRSHAAGLRRRTDIDPFQIVLLVACLALFLVIAYVYVLQ